MKSIYVAILLSLLTFFSSTPSFAQNDDMAKAEAEAKAILNDMAAAAKSLQTISIKFKTQYDNKRTGDKATSSGTLFVKGEKYVLDVNDMVTYTDGKTVYVWQKENAEVDISDFDPTSEDMMSPSRLFGAYQSGYKLKRLADKKIAGADCAQVDLYPIDRKTNIMRLRISVNKANKQMTQFEQSTKAGETLTVTIVSYEVNKPIADSAFVFDFAAHKDVEVVDLR